MKIRILLADIDVDIEDVCDGLDKRKFEIVEANTFAEAVEHLSLTTFDLLISPSHSSEHGTVDEQQLINAATRSNFYIRTIGVCIDPSYRDYMKKCGYTCAVHGNRLADAIAEQTRIIRNKMKVSTR